MNNTVSFGGQRLTKERFAPWVTLDLSGSVLASRKIVQIIGDVRVDANGVLHFLAMHFSDKDELSSEWMGSFDPSSDYLLLEQGTKHPTLFRD